MEQSNILIENSLDYLEGLDQGDLIVKKSHPQKQERHEVWNKISVERDAETATVYICIQNGEKNIISLEVLDELNKCVAGLAEDAELKYVVFHSGRLIVDAEVGNSDIKISSENSRCSGYFSTGANVREMSELSKESAIEYSKYGQSIMRKIQELPQTTIAVIPDGFCVGGGLELSTSCKYRLASEGSIFQMPEKKLGIIPGWRGTQTLPFHVGAKEAEDWIKNNGKSMKAREAYEIGLIDYVVDNPLGTANSMIKNNDDIVSRSKHDSEKITLNGAKIETDEDESRVFADSWDDGTPQGMINFLDRQKKLK